jgi:hypothetical protein
LWCVTSSPLLISHNLAELEPEMIAILKNTDAIRINQVYQGDAGDILTQIDDVWVLQKRFDKSIAVLAVFVGRDFDLNNQVTYHNLSLDLDLAKLNAVK